MSTPSPASATKAIRQAWDTWLASTEIFRSAASENIRAAIRQAWEASAGEFRAEVREAVSEAWGYEDHTEAVKSAVGEWLDANRTEILAEVGKAATDLTSEANR